ncbi:multiple antibiotic resistance (MarC)-like protein [Psychromonas sp. CNPT3]|uniref:MarC family protein n=1 Tax=Psychromonas sp. CNPT3 TaxID=314282 RepID=UPI00006E768C|nr:MarC family protein [Psychromonas sp. CNPT3]AGH81677.1 multiple antibiotic resistance (MarC)-like protein [Psychromonas sp. CNPT3]
MIDTFFALYLKIFFMMTPFFIMSVFITMSKDMSKADKKTAIIKMGIAVMVSCLAFLCFGQYIFSLFGITLDAFKIGAGTVLFLSALDMIRGDGEIPEKDLKQSKDFAVVPLAIPVVVGPGVIGVLLVIGAEMNTPMDFFVVISSLTAAVLTLLWVLFISNRLQNLLGKQGLEIMPKITGLFVSAIGAQIIFSGIKGFLF